MRFAKFENGQLISTTETVDPPEMLIAAIKASAQRRICALVGTTDTTACVVKQLNANMRATELVRKETTSSLTTEEAAEAVALETLAATIKAIRARSNEVEAMVAAGTITTCEQIDEQEWPA